jgi:sugar phosphate isomerase/epimerase
MYFAGFADEVSPLIDEQIRVTKELGWENIEARRVEVEGYSAGMIHDIPDAAFERVVEKLNAAGIKINCFGSAVANWDKKIEAPFEITAAEIKRCIPRMRKLGTKLIRIMSYAVRKEEDQMEEERFRRLREICRMFLEEGLTAVHENCMNYGGMGWSFTLKLIKNVPGLKLVFDTGNPIFTDDRSQPKPCPKQSAWEFYEHVRDHVIYIHIKDGVFDHAAGKSVYSYPGEGAAEIPRIIKDLIARGYDGGISIEPHMGSVFHDATGKHSAKAAEIYVNYGRKMMEIVDKARRELGYSSPLI